MIDSLEIPMWAGDNEALRDHQRRRNEHWMRMRRVREYWMTEHALRSLDDNFWSWLEKQWGLAPYKDPAGNITEEFSIVDDAKYTMFLLKFGT